MGYGGYIYPELQDKSIDFKDPSQIPWQFPTYAEVFITGPDGLKYPAIVEPIIFHKDGKSYPVIVVDSYYGPSYDKKHTFSPAAAEQAMNESVPYAKNDVARLILEDTREQFEGVISDNPIPTKTYQNFPDIRDRFAGFAAGDLSALSQRGIVLLTTATTPQETLFQP